MKIELRTKMNVTMPIFKFFERGGTKSQYCHDAIAAHAYRAAIEQIETTADAAIMYVLRSIETRAAELLASYLDEGK